jgi:hypothetical protein
MKKLKDVRGSKEAAKETIIGVDTVYLHSNVRKCEDEEDMYIYDEVQLTKDEYLERLQNTINTILKNSNIQI